MSWILALPATTVEESVTYPNVDSLFVELPAKEYPIASNHLPIYSESIKIGHIDANTPINITLHYPEYLPLKGKELKWAEEHPQKIQEEIAINSHISFSRKTGYVDLSFSPIVKKGEEYFRLVSCKININVSPNHLLTTHALSRSNPQERWKKESVLKEGTWAKLRVKKEGIYALTPAFLSKMGFNDPSKVKLYGYGGRILEENWTFETDRQVSDDLEEIPLYRKANGDALFFAEGLIRWTYNATSGKWIHENNPYSNYSYYFVTEGENPSAFSTIKADKVSTKEISTVPYYAVEDHDAFGWYTGGREMYDDYDFSHGPSHAFKLAATSCVQSSKKTNVDIAFTASSTFTNTNVSIAHNNNKLGNLSVPKYSSFQSAFEVRKTFSTQIASENSFNFSISPANPARLNFIRINYERELKATDPAFSFTPYTSSEVRLKIKEAKPDTRLWRIGYYLHPTCEIDGILENGNFIASIDEGKQRYVIVNVDENYPTPEWDSKVENQNLHGDLQAYDMIILISESRLLYEEAQRLAEAHEKIQGLRVKIVDAGKIFNEFSSGTPDATAYRRYMKMLYDRATNEKDMPRYLLLFGNCLWDNRMLASENRQLSPKDYLLSFEVTDGFSNPNNTTFPLGEQNSYVTDDYFGWLDDNEGNNYPRNRVDVGIGRFPCSDLETAKILVDKSIEYLKNQQTGTWKNTIYMLADNGNGNLHMNDAETVIGQIEKSTQNNTVIKRVYNDAFTRVSTGTGQTFPTATKILQDAMYQGALIFNYTGHGNPDQLSHAKILNITDFETSSLGNLPLWIMASCEISPYDSKRNDLGRAAITNPNGGAIAVMCASRAVYSNYNRILNIAFNKYLFGYDEEGNRNTLGDAMRLTKVDLVTPNEYEGIKDGSINKLKYLLLGNPAIPLTSPVGNVKLDSINGIAIDKKQTIQLKAGSLVRFSGHITDNHNSRLTNFNGSLTATMMDRLETIVCKNNDQSADEPMTYKEHTKKIFEGSDSVRNGNFSISFRIPRDISYTEDRGRITFYAVNNEKNLECHGSNEQFYLNGTDTTFAPDSLSPKVYLYLDHPDFPDGGITSPNPIFFAKITDDAGINATGIGIGHDMELVIDQDFTSPILLNDHFRYNFGSYREGLVSYPINGLSYGKHSLSFRVWDVNGNSSTNTLSFYVQDGISSAFDVHATENPARTNTSYVVTFPSEDEESSTAYIEVYNLAGQKVWQSENMSLAPQSGYGITKWNLCSNDGARVPAGIYLYSVCVSHNGSNHTSKAKKMIILEK